MCESEAVHLRLSRKTLVSLNDLYLFCSWEVVQTATVSSPSTALLYPWGGGGGDLGDGTWFELPEHGRIRIIKLLCEMS